MGLILKRVTEICHIDDIGFIIGTFDFAYILHRMDYENGLFFKLDLGQTIWLRHYFVKFKFTFYYYYCCRRQCLYINLLYHMLFINSLSL